VLRHYLRGLPDSAALLLLRRELLQREAAQGGSGRVLPYGRRSGVSTGANQTQYQWQRIRPSERGIEPIMPGCSLSLGWWSRGGGGEEEIARKRRRRS
jgi:hypothetical protein